MPGASTAGLEARALQWLAQREHSRQELRIKLLVWAARRARTVRDTVDAEVGGGRARGDDEDPGSSPGAADPGDGRCPDVAAAVDAVLTRLAESGMLSDARFVESRVHVRLPRFGNRRIEAELRQHGVQAPAELMLQLKASEVDRARDALRTRFGGPRRPETDGADAADAAVAQRARRQRFLAARGFSADAIAQALRDPGAD